MFQLEEDHLTKGLWVKKLEMTSGKCDQQEMRQVWKTLEFEFKLNLGSHLELMKAS